MQNTRCDNNENELLHYRQQEATVHLQPIENNVEYTDHRHAQAFHPKVPLPLGNPGPYAIMLPWTHDATSQIVRQSTAVFAGLTFLTKTDIQTDHATCVTNTRPFNGPLSGTTWVSQYQKRKTSLDFTEARDSEWQWHPLGYIQVCISLQT